MIANKLLYKLEMLIYNRTDVFKSIIINKTSG